MSFIDMILISIFVSASVNKIDMEYGFVTLLRSEWVLYWYAPLK